MMVMAAVLLGCSSEPPPPSEVSRPGQPASRGSSEAPGSAAAVGATRNSPGNRPPVVQWAQLSPSPLVLSGPITVTVEAVDPENEAVSLRYQWIVNGTRLEGRTAPSLPPDLLQRGDRVSVEVIPLDGDGQGDLYTIEEVTVVNTPPEVTQIKVEPFPPKLGDRLVAHPEGNDADGDEITYTFRWQRNNTEVEVDDEEGVLDTASFKRGDEIILEVIPHDGTGPGQSLTSDPLAIANSPPEITSKPPAKFPRGLYVYAVTASDRDGDPVTYGLETAPSGMVIDPKTGRLEWKLTDVSKGTYQVRVTASDGQEGEPGFQEFELVF